MLPSLALGTSVLSTCDISACITHAKLAALFSFEACEVLNVLSFYVLQNLRRKSVVSKCFVQSSVRKGDSLRTEPASMHFFKKN